MSSPPDVVALLIGVVSAAWAVSVSGAVAVLLWMEFRDRNR